jgi:hypothetical protein
LIFQAITANNIKRKKKMEEEKQKEEREIDSKEQIDKTCKMLLDLEKNHDPFCAICNKESTRNDEREMQR